jgi:hypothetical protein
MKLILKLKSSLYKNSKTKNIIIILIAAQAINVAMNLFTFPIIQANSHGLMPFDISPMGYSFEYARTFLDALSQNSRNVYLFIQEPLDLFFPLLSSLFFMLLLARLTKNNSNFPFIGLVPLIFDYVENILVINMLIANNISSTLVKVSSIVSIIKSASYTTCYCLIIILLFIRGLKFLRRKK